MIDLHSVTYKLEPSDHLVCPICRNVFVEPVQTECGHIFCQICITTALNTSSTCPVDRRPMNDEDLKPVHRVISNLLDDLEVRCINSKCGKSMKRYLLKYHLQDCEFGKIDGKMKQNSKEVETIPDCTEKISAKLPFPPTDCWHCQSSLEPSEYRQHRLVDCPEIETSCLATSIGCRWHGKQQDLETHKMSCILVSLKPFLETQRSKIEHLELENRALKDQIFNLESVFKGPFLENQNHVLLEVEHIRGEIENLGQNIKLSEIKQSVTSMNETLRTREDIQSLRLLVQQLRNSQHHLVLRSQSLCRDGNSNIEERRIDRQPTRTLSDGSRQETKL
ncbi:TNF receptor-associated factor 6 [Neolecta irregularis DAH-3]|uniref:TNF receptor-associated factor 6 n=1 Tax=Neolecta irregularis (strain DAH-3) TaxID=1198029 RepID=A0A1U7LTU9_NEOID|nr:TNF receptor-associated factor 6 [Neolecta irregularis DAH-3]|eukprot:OLL25941.1 TNF receptor-associated factor 6 [Neolecta irregularis DAH-3]